MWDAVRPMLLFLYGGFYLDHDIHCRRPFDEMLVKHPLLVLREQHNAKNMGNHFMGSIPGHRFWLMVLRNIFHGNMSDGSSVVEHTGPSQILATFKEAARHRQFFLTTYLLPASLIANRENCGKCLSEMCIHEHSVSPAEINGEDDNAETQVERSKVLNTAFRDCSRSHSIFQKLEVFFIHIPKTGGSSIESALGFNGSNHASAAVVKECNSALWDLNASFAVLRHPLSRATSLYKYAKSGGNQTPQDIRKFRFALSMDFNFFLQHLTEGSSDINDRMFASQESFLLDHRHHLIVGNLLCFERLASDWRVLQKNMPSLPDLPSNRYRRGVEVVVGNISSETLALFQDHFHGDYLLWGDHCGDVRRKGGPTARGRSAQSSR
jgi:hypothetical protein